MGAALARLRRLPAEPWLLAAAVVAALLARDALSAFDAQRWALHLTYGLLALSFTFVWGKVGIFSFGQAAFFGVGAYAYAITAINLLPHTGETITALVVAAAAGAALAAMLGYFLFYGNVGGVSVAIVTLAASLVLYTFMSGTAGSAYHVGDALLGGYNGMTGVPPLTHGLPGGTGTPLDQNGMLAAVAIIAAAVALGLRVLLRRPFGRILAGVRENELRTQLLGYDIRRVKLAAFAVGGAIAGLAGGLFAAWGAFVDPSVFALRQAALVAIWVVVGGRVSLLGAFVGVIAVEELSQSLGGAQGTTAPIVLGGVLIAVVLVFRAGIVPTLAGVLTRLRRSGVAAAVPVTPAAPGPFPAPPHAGNGLGPLAVQDVRMDFGGFSALQGVTLEFPARGVHCLIGPNGAGKSTLFGVLSGRQRPTAGVVRLGDQVVTRRRPDERARRGVGIKLQVPSIYPELSTAENLWLAAYGHSRDAEAATRRRDDLLAWLGLSARAAEHAGVLSHGEHQRLEIGMVVAAEPDVILLDEPTAGMTVEETGRMVELVRTLAERACVVVVEHDMDFVRRLDAPVTVLHEGRVFTSGSLAELEADHRVLDIYLGRRAHAPA